MELRPGLSALVTGGAGGIGRAIALALAWKGIFVTVVDFCEGKGREVELLALKEFPKFHKKLELPPVQFVKCDVTDSDELAAAFGKHIEVYGGLDICITCAGVMTSVPFHKNKSDWKRTVNVDFGAVVDSTQLAIRAMKEAKSPGAIIHVASATGLYPMYDDPVYSGSKVVLFTRSLAPYKRRGIRVNVLCPEFVQTELANKMSPAILDLFGGFLPMEMVVKGVFELISNESKAGSCLWISNKRGFVYTPTPTEEEKYSGRPNKKSVDKVAVRIDSTFRPPQAKL